MHTASTEILRSIDPGPLGARVRAAREASGLTQTQLAGDDFSVGYVSRIESGTRRPTLRVLSQIAERLGTTVDALLDTPAAPGRDEIRLGLEYAEISLEVGELEEALQHARASLSMAREAEDSELEQRSRFLVGRALESTGALNDAIIELEHAVRTASGPLAIEAAIVLCRCYRDAGDLTLAIETGETAEARLASLGLEQSDEAVRLAMTTATAYAQRGDLNRAVRRCSEVLAATEHLTSPTARGAAYWNASLFLEMQGDTAAALPLARQALVHLRQGNDSRNLARLGLLLGRLQLQSGSDDLDATIEQLLRAREELQSTSAGAVDLATCDVAIAEAHLVHGDPERAIAVAERVLAVTGDAVPVARAEARVIEGRAAVLLGRTDQAREAYREAVLTLTGIGADRSAAQTWFDLAEHLEELGEYDEARRAFRSAAAASGLSVRAHRAQERTSPTS